MRELVNFKKYHYMWHSWINKNKSYRKDTNLLLGDGIKRIQPNEYLTINSQKKFVCS